MKPDSSLSSNNRREFVKKSLAASIVAAQPSILAGLIRAEGGGGGETTTDPWETTVPETTDPWETGTTVLETTDSETTDSETTDSETTDSETTDSETTDSGSATSTWKAKLATANIGIVDSKIVQIDGNSYSIGLHYKVVALAGSAYWSDTKYYTWFEADLKSKMFNDPVGGPFTGVVTAAGAEARGLSRRLKYQPFCAEVDGEMHCEVAMLALNGDAEYKEGIDLNFTIGGVLYQLSIADPIPGVLSVYTHATISRDRANAMLKRVSDGLLIGAVDADKSYAIGYYEPGASPSSSPYNTGITDDPNTEIDESVLGGDADRKGCFVRCEAKEFSVEGS